MIASYAESLLDRLPLYFFSELSILDYLCRSPFLRVLRVGVLNDQRNAAIGRVEGVFRFAEKLVGKPAHLRYLLVAKALLLHQAAGGIGAVN